VAQQLGSPIAAGKEAELFLFGTGVLKLTRRPGDRGPAEREAANLAAVAPLGLAPAPGSIVEIDGRWGLVMERIAAPTLGAALADPAAWPGLVAEMVALHRRLHAASGAGLPPLKPRLAGRLAGAPGLAPHQREALAARLAALPEGDGICHGDFHPLNILGRGAAARVVDWLDATQGAPAADVCRTYVLAHAVAPALAGLYASAYAAASGLAAADIFAWLPVVAAARLTENVPAERPALHAMALGGAAGSG